MFIQKQNVLLQTLKKAIIIFLLVFIGAHSFAQQMTRKDSLRILKDTTVFYTLDNYKLFTLGEQSLHKADTTLKDLHLYYQGLRQYNFLVSDNPGRPIYPILFQPDSLSGFQLGKENSQYYLYNGRNVKFYKTLRPYTEASYNFAGTGIAKEGKRLEQILSVIHTQRIKKHVQLGLDFRRITAAGFYNHMWAGVTNIRIFGTYFSPSNKYILASSFSFNNTKLFENGGLSPTVNFAQAEETLGGGTTELTRKEQYATRLESAVNHGQNYDLDIYQAFNIGNRSIRIDTNEAEVKIPLFRIGNRFIFKTERYRYIDSTHSSDNYYSNYNWDTSRTFYRIYHQDFGGELEFSFFPWRNKGSFNTISAGIKANYLDVLQDSFFTQTYNTQIFSNLDFSFAKTFRLRGRVDYFFLGYNQNDLRIKADVELALGRKDKPKWGILTPNIMFRLAEPGFLQSRTYSNLFIWNNTFSKTKNLVVGLNLNFPTIRLSFGGQYYALGNFIYYDSTAMATQSNSTLSGYAVWLKYDLKFAKHFHFNTMVVHQGADKDFVRMPPLYVRGNFYYENKLFKKRLLLQIGLDVYYAMKHKGYAYMPATGIWYLQNNAFVGNYPYIDFNISLRIKRFKAFFVINHLNQGFPSKAEYFIAPGQPTSDRQFRVGITWGMFN